jgi:predicted HAD superfamily Cof-like phosphohydrolase
VLKPDNWEADYAPEAKIKAEIERQQVIKENQRPQ